jgi:hypothetical protein
MKITKVADGAYFVPSYSEQTIVRAYSTETTIQAFGYGVEDDHVDPEGKDDLPVSPPSQLPPLFRR